MENTHTHKPNTLGYEQGEAEGGEVRWREKGKSLTVKDVCSSRLGQGGEGSLVGPPLHAELYRVMGSKREGGRELRLTRGLPLDDTFCMECGSNFVLVRRT